MMAKKKVDRELLTRILDLADAAQDRGEVFRERAAECDGVADVLHDMATCVTSGEQVDLDAYLAGVPAGTFMETAEEAGRRAGEDIGAMVHELRGSLPSVGAFSTDKCALEAGAVVAVAQEEVVDAALPDEKEHAEQAEELVDVSGDDAADESVEEVDDADPQGTGVCIEQGEMTDEDMEFLPAGNDLPKPDLPLRVHEVAEIHRQGEYLDRVDGRRMTREQIERFEVERKRHRRDHHHTHTYMCVMCGSDSRIDSTDCDVFGGFPVCKPHGGLIGRYFSDSGIRGFVKRDGQKVEERPFAMHLGYALRKADLRRRDDDSVYEKSVASNLKFETSCLAKLRADEPAEEFATVEGHVDLDPDVLEGRFGGEGYVTSDELALMGVATRRAPARGDSSDDVVHLIADDVEYHIDPVTNDELTVARTEYDFVRLRGPFASLKHRIQDLYVDNPDVPNNGYRRDPAWREVVDQLARIHLAWEQTDGDGHTFWKLKKELNAMLNLQEEHRKKNTEMSSEHAARLKSLMSDPKLLKAVQESRAKRERWHAKKAAADTKKKRRGGKSTKKGKAKKDEGVQKSTKSDEQADKARKNELKKAARDQAKSSGS